MTQEEFETGVKDATDTLIAAHQALVDDWFNLAQQAIASGLDQDRCSTCVAHHLSRLQASIEQKQLNVQA